MDTIKTYRFSEKKKTFILHPVLIGLRILF